MRFRSSQRSFVILKAAEDCCKKWRQKKWGKKEQTGKHQLTGSGSCADMKCYSEIQTKTWSSVAFQIVLLNNAIKTCHLDCLTLSTPPACLIFHRTFSSPSLLRTVCFPTLGSGGVRPAEGPTRATPHFKTPRQAAQMWYRDLPRSEMIWIWKVIFMVMKIFTSTSLFEPPNYCILVP